MICVESFCAGADLPGSTWFAEAGLPFCPGIVAGEVAGFGGEFGWAAFGCPLAGRLFEVAGRGCPFIPGRVWAGAGTAGS